MTFKLHHPLWTHSPALACIATNIGLILYAQIQARVSIDFKNGLSDRWGSPLVLWLATLGMPLLIVIGSAVLDESWAKTEWPRRRFNWTSLIDEFVIGFSVGRNMWMLLQLSKPEPGLSELASSLLIAGLAVEFAVLLELKRPYRPERKTEAVMTGLARSIQYQFQPGGRWLYWETQDSLWSRCLAVLITAPALVIALIFAKEAHYGGMAFFACIAIFILAYFGGVHTALTPGQFTVRGRFGFPLLRLKLANVAKVEAVTFSALLDFLGRGFYRYSLRLRAWGLFLSGGGGVIVQTKNGRRFLIGSKTPEKLAAATEAARIAATLNPDDGKGFAAAAQGIVPNQNASWIDLDSTRMQSARGGGLLLKLVWAGPGILMILCMVIMLWEPNSIIYTITSEGLTIHDLFYSVTIKSTDIDIEHIKIVDIGIDPHWHPTEKINASAGGHYYAGWFHVAGGEKVRMYRTTSQRLVLLPPKGQSVPILIEAKQPEAFIQGVRQAWR